MKKLLLALSLLLAFAPATLAADAPSAEATVPQAATDVVQMVVVEADADVVVEAGQVEQMVTLAALGLPTTALETAIEQVSTAYECPSFTTYCWIGQDQQCDSYCGAVGAGSCYRGCCTCLF